MPRKSTTAVTPKVVTATPYLRWVRSSFGEYDGDKCELIGPADALTVGATVYVSTRKSRDGKADPRKATVLSVLKQWNPPAESTDGTIAETWAKVVVEAPRPAAEVPTKNTGRRLPTLGQAAAAIDPPATAGFSQSQVDEMVRNAVAAAVAQVMAAQSPQPAATAETKSTAKGSASSVKAGDPDPLRPIGRPLRTSRKG